MSGMKAGVLGSLDDKLLDGVDLCRRGGGGGIKIESSSAIFESDDEGFGVI